MAVAPIIHIGGWPGAGKRTIGRIVANRLGGRLIDNHLMLDAARAIYERGSEGSVQLREEVRDVILAHARKLPDDVTIVLTDALAYESVAAALLQPTLDLAKDRGAVVFGFLLELAEEENVRRLTDPSRLGGAKLMDAEVLRHLRATQRLWGPEGAVTIDVTGMTAAQAADVICANIGAADA